MVGILEVESILTKRYQSPLAEAVRRVDAAAMVTDFYPLRALDAGFVRHCLSLIQGVEIDLNAPLAGEDE